MADNGITITRDFDGYPDGKKKRRFKVGEQPTDLPAKYADLLVKKGHATREATTRPAKSGK